MATLPIQRFSKETESTAIKRLKIFDEFKQYQSKIKDKIKTALEEDKQEHYVNQYGN